MKFAHLGDCHLGGWRQPELKELNFISFQYAVKKCLLEKVEFILITGDLFDSAYPPIDILKRTFAEFKKIKDFNTPVFLIAGSHDYSVSGKTFLDVLEKSGFCQNVAIFEDREGSIMLLPTIHKNVAIYGYPGKKSGLEVDEIERLKMQDSPGLFKILMLHTTIRDAIGDVPVKAVDERFLPKVDYLALSHLHIDYNKDGRVYSGPIFPNSISELEELKKGSFYIFDNGRIRKEEIKIKDVVAIHLDISNSLSLTEKLIELLKETNVEDKIVIVRLSGILEQGKISDIDFQKIEDYLTSVRAFSFLKSTSKLHVSEPDFTIAEEYEDAEKEIIKRFAEKNYSKFNVLISDLLNILAIEKLEDETTATFEERLTSDSEKILKV